MSTPCLNEASSQALISTPVQSSSKKIEDEREMEQHLYYRLFVLCFPVILFWVFASRLIGASAESSAPGKTGNSMISEASETTNSIIATIFSS